MKLPEVQAKGQRAESDRWEWQEEDAVILHLPDRDVARYIEGDEEWPEPMPWKPLEAWAMITAVQGLAASQTRSRDVQEFLAYCRHRVAPLSESLSAWREDLSGSGLSMPMVKRKLSVVRSAIRAATAGADAVVRGTVEAVLSAAIPIK